MPIPVNPHSSMTDTDPIKTDLSYSNILGNVTWETP